MHCDSCAKIIPNYLKTLDGVKNAIGSFSKKTIELEFDDKKIDVKTIIEEISNLGYENAKKA